MCGPTGCIRLEEDRLCCLVVIGVKADGSKELLACADGYRESTEYVLRGLKKPNVVDDGIRIEGRRTLPDLVMGSAGVWPAGKEYA